MFPSRFARRRAHRRPPVAADDPVLLDPAGSRLAVGQGQEPGSVSVAPFCLSTSLRPWPRTATPPPSPARYIRNRSASRVTTSRLSPDGRVCRTALRCTSLHRFREAAIFYPNFYPDRQRSGVEMVYPLVTAASLGGWPEFVSSLPSWSCGFDSRRPLQLGGLFRFCVSICPRLKSSTGPQAWPCDVPPAKLQSSNLVMLTRGAGGTTHRPTQNASSLKAGAANLNLPPAPP